MGTGRPGSAVEHLSGRRSGMEQVNWHEIADHRFAQGVASTLCARDEADEIGALVVVAPPRTLAELRNAFSDSLRGMIIA